MATGSSAQWAPGDGRVQFAVLSYQDWQPGFERISVTKPAISLGVGLSERWQLEAGWLVDTISGASPAYHNVVQSAQEIEDTRRAGDVRLTWLGERTRVTAGLARSREIDYDSDAVSLTAAFDSADRNTTFTVGASYTSDEIRPVNRPSFVGRKRVSEVLLGVTRILTSTDIVQVNLTQFVGEGYFNDPYKLLDLRPDRRRQTTLLARWNHHLPEQRATVQTQARLNDDSFGVQAGALAVEWVQELADTWLVAPSARLYRQTAADFYRPPDPSLPPGALPLPPGFVPGVTLNSFDTRLGAFTAYTAGIRVAWQPTPGWTVQWTSDFYRQTHTPTPLSARWHQFSLVRDF